jgi:hypothetical protein
VLSGSTQTSEYINLNGTYYYNWHCVANNQKAFCPFPWHVTTIVDASRLAAYTDGPSLSVLFSGGGYVTGNSLNLPDYTYAWCADNHPDGIPRHLDTGGQFPLYKHSAGAGAAVRCVK